MASGTIEKDADSCTDDEVQVTTISEASPAELTPIQVAEYVSQLTQELAKLARGTQLEVVAYLLDIVTLEAETTFRKLAVPVSD